MTGSHGVEGGTMIAALGFNPWPQSTFTRR